MSDLEFFFSKEFSAHNNNKIAGYVNESSLFCECMFTYISFPMDSTWLNSLNSTADMPIYLPFPWPRRNFLTIIDGIMIPWKTVHLDLTKYHVSMYLVIT